MTANCVAEHKSIFADGKEPVKAKFWNAQPFPHIYFDDFFEAETFRRLVETSRQFEEKPSYVFATELEKNKTTFSTESLSEECRSVVAALTGPDMLSELSELTSIPEITPLSAYKDHKYKFYHKMVEGGFLGSHVDHSGVVGDKVHFLNCIYYAPERWEESWGGETVLFDKWGYRPVARVACKPNRLLIFLHTSQSFHGVSKIEGNRNHRFTVYMDYYAKLKDLPRLDEQSKACHSNFRAKFWKHSTTFVPLTLKHMHRYVRGYLRYLLRPQYSSEERNNAGV